jgi:hypothetical protein
MRWIRDNENKFYMGITKQRGEPLFGTGNAGERIISNKTKEMPDLADDSCSAWLGSSHSVQGFL